MNPSLSPATATRLVTIYQPVVIALKRTAMPSEKPLPVSSPCLSRKAFPKRKSSETIAAGAPQNANEAAYVCFDDAREYIPDLSARRKIDASAGPAKLDAI